MGILMTIGCPMDDFAGLRIGEGWVDLKIKFLIKYTCDMVWLISLTVYCGDFNV